MLTFQPQGGSWVKRGRTEVVKTEQQINWTALFSSLSSSNAGRRANGPSGQHLLPGQLWAGDGSLVVNSFFCSLFCASLQNTLHRDFTTLTCCALWALWDSLLRNSGIKCWDSRVARYWKLKHGSSRDLHVYTKLSDPLSVFPYFNHYLVYVCNLFLLLPF